MMIDSVENLIKFHPDVHIILIGSKNAFYFEPISEALYLWTSEENALAFIEGNNLPAGNILVHDTVQTIDKARLLSLKLLVVDFITVPDNVLVPNYCYIPL